MRSSRVRRTLFPKIVSSSRLGIQSETITFQSVPLFNRLKKPEFNPRTTRIGTEDAFTKGAEFKKLNKAFQSNTPETGVTQSYNFGIGAPGFDPPKRIMQAKSEACLAPQNASYGSPEGEDKTLESLQNHYKHIAGVTIDKKCFAVQPGGKPFIGLSLELFAGTGAKVLVPNKVFPMYPSWGNEKGANVASYQLDPQKGWSLNVENLLSQVSTDPNEPCVIAIVNPANPTGGAIPKKQMAELLNGLAKKIKSNPNIVLVVDEIYNGIVFPDEEESNKQDLDYSILEFTKQEEYKFLENRLIVIDGASKKFCVPGWRLGWGVFYGEELSEMARTYIINKWSCVDKTNQAALREALDGYPKEDPNSDQSVAFKAKKFGERAKVAFEGLNQIQGVNGRQAFEVKSMPRGGFYIFPNVTGSGLTAIDVEHLLRDHAMVHTLSGFGGTPKDNEGNIRISLSAPVKTVKAGIEQIQDVTDHFLQDGGNFANTNVMVIGAGPMGDVIANNVHHNKDKKIGLTVVTKHSKERLVKEGLKVMPLGSESITETPLEAEQVISAIKGWEGKNPPRHIFISTKIGQNERVAKEIAQMLDNYRDEEGYVPPNIIICQNGVANSDAFKDLANNYGCNVFKNVMAVAAHRNEKGVTDVSVENAWKIGLVYPGNPKYGGNSQVPDYILEAGDLPGKGQGTYASRYKTIGLVASMAGIGFNNVQRCAHPGLAEIEKNFKNIGNYVANLLRDLGLGQGVYGDIVQHLDTKVTFMNRTQTIRQILEAAVKELHQVALGWGKKLGWENSVKSAEDYLKDCIQYFTDAKTHTPSTVAKIQQKTRAEILFNFDLANTQLKVETPILQGLANLVINYNSTL